MTEFDIFTAALNQADPAARVAYLDHACGEDPKRRRRIEVLLKAHELAEGFLEDTPPAPESTDAITDGLVVAPAPPSTLTEAPGSRIGPYKLLQQIGEGGMGVVFMAEQEHPVRRKVALKIIKTGMDSHQVIARFEAERQALALMDHPNIAKVFDAGTTHSGRPYFVMELVKGLPLTDYCDRHRMGLPERLTLFRQICSAVQHAHQKGIIHRDLKPTNILVESHDDKPVPKVIDFGLAKAISGLQLTERSLFTAFGSVAGTPLYMAPEQANFNALDVDTRADIYTLGVILYELLTGTTPIRRETFQRAALDEMLRVIREEEPPTPSSRLSTSDALPSLAANRHIEPTRLSPFVKGDLDWIVMKALAKERHRRYESAIGLANDIERFTQHEPVSAGPPSSAYRLRKFVRRNRPQVMAAALILMAMVAGIVGTTLGLIEARRQERVAIAETQEKEKARLAESLQRQQAEKRLTQIAKSNEILGSIFKDLDPGNEEKPSVPAAVMLEESLDRATAEIQGDAIGDPLSVARMQMVLGRSQIGLGSYPKAIVLFTKARATFTDLLGQDDSETLACMNRLARAYNYANRKEEALPLWKETLALRKSKLGPDHPDTLETMHGLADCYRGTGKLDQALPILEQVLPLQKAKLGPDHIETLKSMMCLADCYIHDGQHQRAFSLDQEAFTRLKSTFGPDHPETLDCMDGLAEAHEALGRLEQGLQLRQELLALRRAKLGPDHPRTLSALHRLAYALKEIGQTDKALQLFQETFALTRAKLGSDHPDTIHRKGDLALAYQDAGKPELASPLFLELTTDMKRKEGADSTRYAGALTSLGLCLIQEKKWVDAETKLRESLAIRESKRLDDFWAFSNRSILGGAVLGQKKFDLAEPLLRTGYEGMKRRAEQTRRAAAPRAVRQRLEEALDRLIELAEATGKPNEAKAWRDEKAKLAGPSTPRPEPKQK